MLKRIHCYQVWDATTIGLTQASTIVTAPVSCTGSLTERAVWKAHDGQVSSLCWAALPAGRFLLSAAHDKSIKLWDEGGVLVGTFGNTSWSLDDPATWEAKERQPLKVSRMDTTWCGVSEYCGACAAAHML
eukprot:303980-Chlamydomonas_euryale.AAC.7